jgi:hypothetical protein
LENTTPFPSATGRFCPFEAIALAAGIDLRHLLAATMLALDAQSVDTSKIIYATGHPAVAEARVKNALQAGGHRDRDAIDMHRGFLPSPSRGGVVVNQAVITSSGRDTMNAQGAGRGGTVEADEDDGGRLLPLDEINDNLDGTFPPPVAMQERLVPIRNRQLSAGEQSAQAQNAKDGPVSHWSDDEREHVRLDMKRVMNPEKMTSEEWENMRRLERTNTVFK